MPRRMNVQPEENTRKSNIQKWRETADTKDVQTAMSKGAYASHAVRSTKKAVADKLEKMLQTEDIPALMQTMLLGELPSDQRDYVRSLVPDCIPDDSISPIVAMTYACIAETVKKGDVAGMQKLLQMSGQTAELAVKLDVHTEEITEESVKAMSTEELMRRLQKCKAQAVVDADYEEVP